MTVIVIWVPSKNSSTIKSTPKRPDSARIDAATGRRTARSMALVANLSSTACIAPGSWPTTQQRAITVSSVAGIG